MGSAWPSVLASLDQDLALLCESLDSLEAAASVDIGKVIQQLKTAVAVSVELRELVLSELPDATWQDRKELQAVLEEITKRVEARELEQRRAGLLALATEVERGNIVHRRAARVTQVNEFREEAVSELRTLAASDAPPAVPGPAAEQWVPWACHLKEPDDAASLQALRQNFPWLDEFVANLEPDMWVTTSGPASTSAIDGLPMAPGAAEIEERRARLLALATALEGGTVVHHRAIRVTQVNQLRDDAIAELRSHAQSKGVPPNLPGPESQEWIEWACSLTEPEDADALQSLRDGFVKLDEFVTNLEPGMWTRPGQPKLEVAARTETAYETQEKSKPAKAKAPEAAPAEPILKPQPVIPAKAAAPEPKKAVLPVMAKVKELWQTNSRMFLGGVLALVLLMLAAILWASHRRHTSSTVSAVQAAVPDTTHATTTVPMEASAATLPGTAAAPGSADSRNTNVAKPKEQDATAAERPVKLLNDAALRTPQAIPGRAKKDDSSDAPNLIASALTPNSLPNVVRDIPVAQPKAADQKIRVSGGVAQGQLVHQVAPQYPSFARTAGIKGTVVLQAVIGKDGTVKNVQALHGPPALIQAAVDAVKQWRYKPFSLNGEPAEADIQVNVNFNP